MCENCWSNSINCCNASAGDKIGAEHILERKNTRMTIEGTDSYLWTLAKLPLPQTQIAADVLNQSTQVSAKFK